MLMGVKMSGLFAKKEQNKLLKAFNEAVEVKRLNSHSYEAILETGDVIKGVIRRGFLR